jgi:hypothetical protein
MRPNCASVIRARLEGLQSALGVEGVCDIFHAIDAVSCRLKYASFAFEYAIDFRSGGMVSFCAEANLWVVGGDNV